MSALINYTLSSVRVAGRAIAVFSVVLAASTAGTSSVSAQSCGGSACGCETAGGEFSFPARSHGCGGGQFRQELQAKTAAIRAESAKVSARNAAWPKPFGCASRHLYHSIWNPMIDAGFEDQCMLSSTHFDKETGELTKYGVNQISQMMRNMPSHRRVIYIQRDVDEATSQARYNKVSDIVDNWYGASGRVAFSDRQPATGTGQRAELISTLSGQAMPRPIIPIASGSSSVGASIE